MTTLTDEQKQRMLQEGFVLLKHAVPTDLVHRARQAINHRMGRGMHPDEMTRFRVQSYFPELKTTPEILDTLTRSAVFPTAQAFAGGGLLEPAGAQLALRFPAAPGDQPKPPGPHVDGTPSPNNGVPPGTLASFTMLAGVMLSDVAVPHRGNFTVWPGGHRKVGAFLAEHGPDPLIKGLAALDLDLGEPHPICAEAGDAVLAHYMLPHSVGPHTGPDIRYTLFARLRHRDHDHHRQQAMRNLWHEWTINGAA